MNIQRMTAANKALNGER